MRYYFKIGSVKLSREVLKEVYKLNYKWAQKYQLKQLPKEKKYLYLDTIDGRLYYSSEIYNNGSEAYQEKSLADILCGNIKKYKKVNYESNWK